MKGKRRERQGREGTQREEREEWALPLLANIPAGGTHEDGIRLPKNCCGFLSNYLRVAVVIALMFNVDTVVTVQ